MWHGIKKKQKKKTKETRQNYNIVSIYPREDDV